MDNGMESAAIAIEVEVAELQARVAELEKMVERLTEYAKSPFRFAPVALTNSAVQR